MVESCVTYLLWLYLYDSFWRMLDFAGIDPGAISFCLHLTALPPFTPTLLLGLLFSCLGTRFFTVYATQNAFMK